MTKPTANVVRTFSAVIDGADMERVHVIVETEVVPALRQPGNTHVFACFGPPTPGTGQVEAFLFTAWESREALDRIIEQPAIGVALMKLLGFVRAAPSQQTYEVRALREDRDAAASDAPVASDGWVDEIWGTVQAQMRSHTYRFEDHPYVRWFMLNSDDLPDFVAAAREHDPELTERLLAQYREAGRGGVDDLEPGMIRPRSRTAQHLYYLVRVISRFGLTPDAAVLDIGGGFGNLARMLLQLGACERCDLVDIGGVTALQEEYLRKWLPSDPARYRLYDIQRDSDREALAGREHDLVVSTFGLSETPEAMRAWYIDNVLLRARRVYVVGQEVWHGENVFRQLRERLSGAFTCDEQSFLYQSPHAATRYLELFAWREPGTQA
ncbi:MAG TPA: hypothetical protein VOB72_22275 [Candidatus Dormibacteraeota bacterium]|nr:hypothetical protein [Candidatus Dormibacteraeota bacterium]